MVVVNGLFNLVYTDGLSIGGLIKFGILAALPAWWLGRHAMGKGYNLLSDGADKNYRPGRDLYMDGQYVEAFAHLEPSAKRGHMKSLYLLGHAHEHGNGREIERITAARFYDKAGRKGYGKAHHAFEALFETFGPEEIKTFETNLGISEINELI
ncbi:MAG: sel1 repeat family protein [Robiginitomaculum sp.]|nr:sel1 repeat family protein [Robiginitomaculum sp.]